MNLKFYYSLSILVLLLLTSCDAEHIKDYTVINDCGDPVILSYKIGISDILQHKAIRSNDSVLIYHHSYLYGTVGVSDDRDRLSVKDISINVNNKTISVNKNDWQYVQNGKYYADYFLKIDASLLNRNN